MVGFFIYMLGVMGVGFLVIMVFVGFSVLIGFFIVLEVVNFVFDFDIDV